MKCKLKLSFFSLFCLTALSVNAAENDSQNLSQYLQYLGGYLGYDLSQNPSGNDRTVTAELLSTATTQLAENYVFNTFFGALPVSFVSGMMIVPQNFPGSQIVNKLANATFQYQQYQNPGADNGKVSVNPLIDQQTFQSDPVNQAVLNILGTPDVSYCMSYDKSSWTADCKLLSQNKVMDNVVGTLPKSNEFFSYEYNQAVISQLNSNSLLGPLLYATESAGQGTGSPTPSSNNPGLVSQNQAQQANNFILYASAAVAPGTLPEQAAYDKMYVKATTQTDSTATTPSLEQIQAQSTLTNYLANLRVFAAQSSVGVSNLYFILSKRLPQNLGGDNSILTSQAMSEFNLASWRLFKGDLRPNKQWINQINDASTATVQKEIVTLLAEINYQLYLDRQIQERILLTNSIMLIQNTRASQPSASFIQNNTQSSS